VGIASEENDDYHSRGSDNSHNNNKYASLMDPLDGSSNIDVMFLLELYFSL
jgi:fructose-1,6-bisphosphatase